MKAKETIDSTISLFAEASTLIKSRMHRVLPQSFTQCQTIWFIYQKESHQEKPTMQDIARYFKITAPSATALIDELTKNGLIARNVSTQDRRKIELTLTTKGKKLFKTMTEKRTKILGDILKVLSAADREDLNRILKKILESN